MTSHQRSKSSKRTNVVAIESTIVTRGRKQLSSPSPLLSPKTAKLKAQSEKLTRRAMIAKAAMDVKAGGMANGGETKYGNISAIVPKYQSIGYPYITRGTICHHLSFIEKKPTIHHQFQQ